MFLSVRWFSLLLMLWRWTSSHTRDQTSLTVLLTNGSKKLTCVRLLLEGVSFASVGEKRGKMK